MNKINLQAKWMDEVLSHHEEVRKKGYLPMITALYGSQNYSLATDDSDVDTKTFLMPCFSDVVLHKEMISKELVAPTGSHIEIKDYRDMCKNIQKQSINFLETLFTPYVIVEPHYQDFYNTLYLNRERIARMDVNRAVKSTYGHMSNMEHKFKRDGNMKQAATLMRLHDFVLRYLDEEPYENILFNPNNLDFLQEVRAGKVNCEQVKEYLEFYMTDLQYTVDTMKKIPIDEKTLALLEYAQVEAFVKKYGC